MPRYIISAEECDPITLDCPGCSGDALELALETKGMHSFRMQKRSPTDLAIGLKLISKGKPPVQTQK